MEDIYTSFKSYFQGHDVKARNLIRKYVSLDKLAAMTDLDVQNIINEYFVGIFIDDKETWILIPKNKITEFEQNVTLIRR